MYSIETRKHNFLTKQTIMKKTAIIIAMLLCGAVSFAQVKGKVVDKSTKEVLVGATVATTNSSVSTALDGSFNLKTAKVGDKLKVSYVGYGEVEVIATNGVVIELASTSIGLKEVAILSSVGIDRKTPAAISTINTKYAIENLGSQELPELLKVTPSAFATKSGGGFGDSRISIRGFDQRNIAVLVNGVPVNDMENGQVYFSNWAGIGDALKQIQVQRGLGASKLAIQSVGGTMNIITKTTDATKGGSVQQSFTDFGQWKTVLSYSTGNTKAGAFSFVGSTTQGNGYINGTGVNAYSYFLSYAKDLNDKNKIQFTLLGAPQQHGQRSSRITPTEFDKYGIRYNKDLYLLNGEQGNLNINYFHKPIASLNHYWTISPKTSLTTAIYASFGHGGGSGILGTTTATRDSNGVLLMDGQFSANYASTTGSKYIIRNSVNNHTWYGVLSTFNHKLKDFDFTLGVDGRSYKGEHFREVRNLLGGAYWKDTYAPTSTVDPNSSSYLNVFQVTPATNRIAYDNDGLVDYYGTFGQVEYSKNKLSAFAQGALSQTVYSRIDRYNATHTPNRATTVRINGYNAKVGANYNFTDKHNVFANVGTYSRAPYFNFIFVGSGATPNAVNANIKNEEANAVELGYGFRTRAVRVKLNAYYTEFKNRSLQSPLLTAADGTQYRALVTGQNALHRGIEAEVQTKPIKNLDVNVFASFGDWKWKGNASATIRDEATGTDKFVNVYSDGLYVGDQPQTQVGAYARYQITKKLDISATYTHNDKYYAYFDPSTRTNSAVTAQPYKFDDYGVMDARVGYKFNLGGYETYAQLQVYNVLDKKYWVEGNDGSGTAAGTLLNGFQGWGRNSNLSVKLNF